MLQTYMFSGFCKADRREKAHGGWYIYRYRRSMDDQRGRENFIGELRQDWYFGIVFENRDTYPAARGAFFP
jgi:hypothetical protein